MRLFRVFPWDPHAVPTEPGGALYVPPGGSGRVDNAALYRVRYASSDPAGAVAEGFGRFPMWDASMLVHANGNRYAIAVYELASHARLFTLDDPAHLALLNLKPSDVVRRDVKRSQSWARTIYDMGNWDGISWWSYYGPQWQSVAIWNIELMTLASAPEPLTIASAPVHEAATSIVRLIK